MTASQYVVVLREQGTAYGPFSHHSTAVQFAAYLTAEVDPADVCGLCSPVEDLLTWREHIALPLMNAQKGGEGR